jgi:hypothetical protein
VGNRGTKPNVVAEVEGTTITVEALQAELARRFRSGPVHGSPEQVRDAVLDDMVRFEVLFARAAAAGLDRDPDLVQRFRRAVVARFEERSGLTSETNVTPTAEEVANHHRTHADEFREPEKVRLATIFWNVSPKATEEKKAEVRRRAEAVRAEAASTNASAPAFTELVRRHSDDTTTRYTGGDLGWFTRGETNCGFPPELLDAGFALNSPGDLSALVPTADGLYLLQLRERRAATITPLERVRDRIAWQLRKERTQQRERDFYRQQTNGLRLTVYRAVLEQVQVPAAWPESPPPRGPGL